MKKKVQSSNLRVNPKELDISIIISVLNEEGNLLELYARLSKVIEKSEKSYEIIFTDDGSKDKSFEILMNFHQKDKKVKIIKFSRNFGHHMALCAGLDYCKGEAVVLMDGDLQDRPEDIPDLLSKIEQGYDVVYALRKSHESPFLDRITSEIFYKIFNKFAKIDIVQHAGNFRVMRRDIVDILNKLKERSRFIPGLIDWTGFKSTGVEVKREARLAGKRKYNFWKRLRLAVVAIVSFSHFPLQIAGYLGFTVAGLSFLSGIYLIIRKLFFGIPLVGYTSLIVPIFFLAGVQLIVLGVIGEYIGKIFIEVQHRPLYIIEKIIE